MSLGTFKVVAFQVSPCRNVGLKENQTLSSSEKILIFYLFTTWIQAYTSYIGNVGLVTMSLDIFPFYCSIFPEVGLGEKTNAHTPK